ncbi:MAG: thioredoxin domain-containing protein [Bacteriovoracia bacterium]
MKKLLLPFLLLILAIGCRDNHSPSAGNSSDAKGFNHLKSEKSPYLQQHAENPVWWYPWGDEAFKAAKEQNKPIFLSVGYSTCHWCHVMEEDSFTRPEVAEVLNRAFIAIKVDREERPDVDKIYMEAVQAFTGSGGWPMTVLLTPDREPFFGGTFFPRTQLLQVLNQIEEVWKNNPQKIREDGKRIASSLKDRKWDKISSSFSDRIFVTFFKNWSGSFDSTYGGRKGAPKFPPAYDLRLLLRIYRRTDDPRALEMVTKTLDEMAKGGIYDHVGGGFHRYSTDGKWLIPHFEKMLYDQAALLSAYTEGFQVTRKKEHELVARETADYVLRDLRDPKGGFYSAEDADSSGKEGLFYVWKLKELSQILTKDEFSAIGSTFLISRGGNFEDEQNVLSLKATASRETRPLIVKSALEKMAQVRSKRIRPARDEKILTAWNGLMISALVRASTIFKEPRYLEAGEKAAEFIQAHLTKDGKLLRRWIANEAKGESFLEDYAFLIDALIELFQATSETKWLTEAERLQKLQDEMFFDSKSGTYFLTSGHDPSLLHRVQDFEDNVTPSGVSVTALNYLRLFGITFKDSYQQKAAQIFQSMPVFVEQYPTAFSQFLMAVDFNLDRSKEIAVIADQEDLAVHSARNSIFEIFNPNKVIAIGLGRGAVPLLKGKTAQNGKPTIYVCENHVCQLPTTDLEKAVKFINLTRKYSLR